MNPRILLPTVFILSACSQGDISNADSPIPPLLEPRVSQPLSFQAPQTCAECHPGHVEQWSISNHAYAAVDPVYHAMVSAGQAATSGKLDQFCTQCHSPVGMVSGETEVFFDEDKEVFAQKTQNLDPVAMSGVSCDVCHSITNVVEPVNARMVYTPNGVKRATIQDPTETTAHTSEFSPLHGKSELCGSCHAVINGAGALIEETFPEWASSSAATRGENCQHCHMPASDGQAAKDGPNRTIHDHTFVGVDVSLLPENEFPGFHELREKTAALLQSAAELSLEVEPGGAGATAKIVNLAGHALPSGATAERQMWIELVVRDASGSVVFESGTLDENEDVRDGLDKHTTQPGTDPQLAYFGQLLVKIPGLADATDPKERRAQVTEQCIPIGRGGLESGSAAEPVTFPWEANWQCNYMIPPDQTAAHRYSFDELPSGNYTLSARLLFRTFPPYFLRELETLAGLDPDVKTRVPTVEMASAQLDFERICEDPECSQGGGQPARYPGRYGVAINEVMSVVIENDGTGFVCDTNADRYVDEHDDEFVELVNVWDVELRIDGCTIENLLGVVHVFPPSTEPLLPGEAIVVFGGGQPNLPPPAARAQVASTGWLDLWNGLEGVYLECPADDGEMTVIDGVLILDDEQQTNQSLTRSIDSDVFSSLVPHRQTGSGEPFSPGLRSNGEGFAARR